MAIKKVENGNWMYDIRHPITKRRHRIGGFRTKGEATEARDNQVARWKAEKFGLDAPEVRSRLLLRDALRDESARLRAEYDRTFSTTRKSYLSAWARKLADYPGFPEGLRVTDLKPEHLNEFIDAELARGIKPSSLNTRMTNLKYILRRIREHNKSELAHWELPKHKRVPGFVGRGGRKLRRVWTDEEFNAVLKVLANPDKYSDSQRRDDVRKTWRDVSDFLQIAALTGMRKTEILLLKWDRIFFSWNVMQARTLKRKAGVEEYRDIPLTDALAGILKRRREYIQANYTENLDWVFPRFKNGDYYADWIYHTLYKVCPIAGVEYGQKNGVVPHGLRHTAATKMVTRGVDLSTAAEVLGNKVETMLESYAHATMDSKRSAMSALNPAPPESAANRENVVELGKKRKKAA